MTQDFGKRVIRIGEDPLPAPARKELRRLKAGIDMEFRQLIAQGIAEGSLRDCDPKIAAFMLAGALSWVGRWYRDDGDLSADQVAEQGIALLLGGVLKKTAAGAEGDSGMNAPADHGSSLIGAPPDANEPGARVRCPARRRGGFVPGLRGHR